MNTPPPNTQPNAPTRHLPHTLPNTHRTIALLTGATGGIGLGVAHLLADAGYLLILPGRRPDAMEALCHTLTQDTQNPHIYWLPCDLASQDSIRTAAHTLTTTLPHLDRLIHCAGRYGATYQETPDGLESHLAINYLAPFLLTHLLLPTLERAEAARIVNVAGETARFARIRMNDLNRRQRFSTLGAYGQSKLALILFSRTLAKHLAQQGSPILVNALQPGMAATDHLASGPTWLNRLWRAISPDPMRASRAVARLALNPHRDGTSGRYYFGRLRAPAPCAAYRDTLAHNLYTRSLELTGLTTVKSHA